MDSPLLTGGQQTSVKDIISWGEEWGDFRGILREIIPNRKMHYLLLIIMAIVISINSSSRVSKQVVSHHSQHYQSLFL